MFGLTYILDMILVADIFVSMKKAIVTPTGTYVQNSIIVRNIAMSEDTWATTGIYKDIPYSHTKL